MRIGITGHANLPAASVPLIRRALAEVMGGYHGGHVVGVSNLCRGADQLFAAEVLAMGGQLEVILPAFDYRTRMVAPEDAEQFDSLLAKAASVRHAAFARSCRESFRAAGRMVLDESDLLIAVWDGRCSRQLGDTADIVALARSNDIRTIVVWPQ